MQVDIEAEQHKDVVLIPAVAIVREGDDDGRLRRHAAKRPNDAPLQIGLTDGTHVEIVSGVKAGEMVIVDGQAGLPDGAAITVTTEPQTGSEPAPAATEKDEAK